MGKEVIPMSEKSDDLIVLEEGGEANVVQACCKSTASSKL
jgi:hypothetical protein